MIFDQVDGLAIGSFLWTVLANIFTSYYERNWINTYNKTKPLFYTRYVDDIFCQFEIW